MGAALFLLFDLYRVESVRRSDVHAYIIECCSVPSVRDSFGDESVEVAARRTGEPPHALTRQPGRVFSVTSRVKRACPEAVEQMTACPS